MHQTSANRQIPTAVGKDSPAVSDLHALLLETSDALAAGRSLDAILDVVLRRTRELVGIEHGFVATLDPDGLSMGLRAAHGLFASRRLPHFAPSIGVFGRAWAESEPMLIEDYESWSGRGLDMQAAGAHGLALVPVKMLGNVVGLLGVATTHPSPSLDRATLDLLSTLSHLAALAIGAHGAAGTRPVAPTATPGAKSAPHSRRSAAETYFDRIPAVVMVKDRENRVLRANAAAARMLSLPLEEVEGRYFWELDPESAATSYRHDLEVVESGAPVLDRIEEHVDAVGERRWWSFDRAPVFDDRGRVASIVVLARDVSEEHVGRTRLEASRHSAERADRIRSHTLAALAQDVRVPLERVHEIADRLLASTSDLEADADFADLRFAAESALTHVQDLLDFARVEAGNLPVECAPLDLRELVEDVLELAWQGAHARGIVVAGHVDPSIPAMLHGDLVRVRQVLVQLLAQALRAVSGGEVVVSARTVLRSEHHCEVRLEVHASEWSPLPQELEAMFGPFLHGEDALDANSGPGATGLALAHRLVQMLGGRVGLQTASEGELSCWCSFPFDRVPLDDMVLASQVRPRAGVRVLVVETHASSARVLTRQLQDLGAVVDTRFRRHGRTRHGRAGARRRVVLRSLRRQREPHRSRRADLDREAGRRTPASRTRDPSRPVRPALAAGGRSPCAARTRDSPSPCAVFGWPR
jgi:PAS domain S-box-containing protein